MITYWNFHSKGLVIIIIIIIIIITLLKLLIDYVIDVDIRRLYYSDETEGIIQELYTIETRDVIILQRVRFCTSLVSLPYLA